MKERCEADDLRLLKKAEFNTFLLQLTIAFGGAFALLIFSLYIKQLSSDDFASDRWGQFGDYFGGILNPIFSFLGLIAIVITLRLQNEQLRDSLKETFNQNKRADLIQFESTFFQLIELHNKITEDAAVDSGLDKIFYGRNAFKLLQKRIDSIRFHTDLGKNFSAIEIYEMVYLANEDLMAHYFRNMYHVMKFIDKSSVEDQQYYADLLRAQLSSSEAVLLFYNGTSTWGQKRAKPLIEKFGLLKTLPSNVELPKELVLNYAPQAFRNGFHARYSK